MNRNFRTVKSPLNNLANFLVMVMVAGLLLFTIYLSRQNRRVRREYHRRILAAEKKIDQLQHAIDRKNFVVEQLKKQLQQLRNQDKRQ